MKLFKKVFTNLVSFYLGMNLAVFIYGWFWSGRYHTETGRWPTSSEFFNHVNQLLHD